MKWIEIAGLPTMVAQLPGTDAIHENCYRSFHLLRKVTEYIRRGVPGDIILELIGELDELATLKALADHATVPQNGQGKTLS